MRFIVCARNRSDGGTFVVGQRSYPDKDAAIAALGGSAALPELADCELFVLDLDAGTPVVLVHTPVERPVRLEPEQVAAPATAAPILDEAPAIEAEPAVEDEIGERLEDSDVWSIVDSIGEEAMDAALGSDDVPTPLWWLGSAPGDDVIQVSIYDCTDDFGGEQPAEETAVTRETPLFEADADREAETVGAHEGAMAAADLQDAAQESATRAAAVDEPARDEPLIEAYFSSERPADEPINDPRVGAEPLPELIETPESDPGFMRVDFSAWTCVDCVFTSTCERTDDESPADCGSFQWRPA